MGAEFKYLQSPYQVLHHKEMTVPMTLCFGSIQEVYSVGVMVTKAISNHESDLICLCVFMFTYASV